MIRVPVTKKAVKMRRNREILTLLCLGKNVDTGNGGEYAAVSGDGL